MQHRLSTTQHNDRRARFPQRGAVILLSSYLVSFTLLVLTTAMFVRSANEVRLAERSTQLSQAFWGAEAALDAGIAALATQPESRFALNQWCTSSQATKVTGATYRLCLEAQDTSTSTSRYRIEATGTQNGSRETLTAQVNRQTDTVQFDRVASVNDQLDFLYIATGGMDSRVSTDPALAPVHVQSRGDIGTSASKVQDGHVRFTGHINGDIYVGPGGETPPVQTILSSNGKPVRMVQGELVAGGEVSGTVKNLAAVPKFPPVEVPSNATDLGDLEVRPWNYDADLGIRSHDEVKDKRCLEPGTYVVRNLTVGAHQWNPDQDGYFLGIGAGELCTTGPVDLYVTGALMMSHGEIYGQPKGSPPYAKQYSPENLRIFVKGSRRVYCGFLGTPIEAALLYAPESQVVQLSYQSTWMGAIIARSMYLWGQGANIGGMFGAVTSDSPGAGKLFYDEALRGRKFQVGPAKVTTLVWNRQATGTDTTTSSKPIEVLPTPTAGQPISGGCTF